MSGNSGNAILKFPVQNEHEFESNRIKIVNPNVRSLRPPKLNIRIRCCIAGGGPAGMMLGFLLARAGVSVVVLEKHADFLRDFRGDTIHPSTLEIMDELGLLDEFLKQPHQEVRELRAVVNGQVVPIADF